ncbi:TetR/AcrR family transcriptional regulator C-terminal domain-containing protein [Gorillibacterium massiliense]|uniref:TetR/AcrR family transcriptional regulator C-terminal domain-containing protein n=1 Tax=Gorillibacterium massiliense TaxID=1280390 RepID=UPI0004B59632|nr:TetR/AcrR family transcriptional regulator C-terminal domain-containing protein [Gorillibacterium massiliense]
MLRKRLITTPQIFFQSLANEVSKEALQAVVLKGDWKSQLTDFAVTIKHTMTKYPCSAQLFMRAFPSEANYLALNNALLQIVDPLPLSDSDKFSSIACLLNYIISFELDRYEQRKVNKELKADASKLFQASLARLPEDGTFVIKRMHENGIFKEIGSDKMFETGLNIIVLGMEQLAVRSG